MKRFAAHLVYCNPQRIIAKGVIEIDNDGFITNIFSLNDLLQESHSTIFYNGILIPDLLEKDEISSLIHESVFATLNKSFSINKRGIEVGEKADVYLLEKLDLIENKFLKKTALIKIL